MKIYNKLVRDKIPEIITENNGKTCKIKILEHDEYLASLNAKLQEELKEYLESGEVEELADLEEVLRAILDAKNISYEEFEKIRNSKVNKRGAFKKKIFLESVEEQKNNFHRKVSFDILNKFKLTIKILTTCIYKQNVVLSNKLI